MMMRKPRADLTNMSSTENVNPIFTKRVKSAHPSSLIIGDIASPIQTRSRVNKSSNGESALVCYIKNQRRNNHIDFHHCLFACFLSQTEPRSVAQALEDPRKRQLELMILKNKKIASRDVIRNKARLVPSHKQKRALDYEEVSMVYKMMLKVPFSMGRLKKRYMSLSLRILESKASQKSFTRMAKALYGHISASRACYATLSLPWRGGVKEWDIEYTIDKTLSSKRTQIYHPSSSLYDDIHFWVSTKKACSKIKRIFISQDKYVAKILRKFDLESVKTATTPYEPQKPKDKNRPDEFEFTNN
ncbi:hypothetical protein Tco_1429551 [Tanacetum coccineum]